MRAPALPRRMKTDRAASRILASVSADFFGVTGAFFFLAIRFNCLVNDEDNEEAGVNAQANRRLPGPWSSVLYTSPLGQAGFDLDLRAEGAGNRTTLPRILRQLLQLGVIEAGGDHSHVE